MKKARRWLLTGCSPSSVKELKRPSLTQVQCVCSTCPSGFAPLAALEDVAGERPLRAAPPQVLTKYRAANVQRPIVSLSEAVNGGNVGFFSKDFSGIARAGDIEIVVKGDYIPLMQKGGLFEICLVRPKVMPESGQRAAEPSSELQRLPTVEALKSETQEVIDEWQRRQACQQMRRSPGTMRRIFRSVRGARCACKERPGKVGTRPGQSK